MSTPPQTPESPRRRLSQEDRKVSIARAAAKLFAERGFHATGSRDLARACGISEALMFRYFPNKEELWKAALESCRRNAVADSLRSIPSRPPSTAGLVDMTWELAEDFLATGPGERVENRNTIHRMLLRSLAEDGEFARMLTSDLSAGMAGYISECLAVARAAGEVDTAPNDDLIVSRFYRLLLFAIASHVMQDEPVMRFDVPGRALIESFVRFQLRALGFKVEVVDREVGAYAAARGKKRAVKARRN